jgi:hypothetical protein
VLSGWSVCLSVGGGLTLFVAVGQWSDRVWLCRPSPTEDRQSGHKAKASAFAEAEATEHGRSPWPASGRSVRA